MKKLLKLAICFFATTLFVSTFVACDNDPDIDISVKEKLSLQAPLGKKN